MNTLFHQNEKTTVFRAFSMLYKLINILFAIDFGFLEIKSAKNKMIYRAVAALQATIISFYLVYTFYIMNGDIAIFWNCLYIYRYVLYVIFLLCKYDINFHNFLCDFKPIDASLGVDRASYGLEKKMLAIIFTLFVYNTVIILACYYSFNVVIMTSFVHTIIFIFMIVCIDFVCATNIFFYYAVLCRLKKLYSILKMVNSNFRSFQMVYKSIVDVLEKYKPAFDYVFLTTIFFCVVQVMSLVYILVNFVINEGLSPVSLLMGLNEIAIIVALMLMFGTALCAGMLTAQANAIKMVLLDKELECRDEAISREVARFIRYLDTRGCHYRVFKVIPLDADLLGMVLGFIATYLIVIIQFTRPD